MGKAKKSIRTAIMKHLLNRNYYFARMSSHLWWNVKSLGQQPLVIYQMGKVGSTSILYSLHVSVPGTPVFQVHALSDQGILDMERKYWGETPRVFRKPLLPETTHVFASHYLRAQLNKDLTKKRWKIITLVRDPIARNASEFFFSIDTTKNDPYLPDFYERYRTKNISTEELIERFIARFHVNSEEYQLPLKWFDTELKAVLGIDVFSGNFPKLKGYQIIHGEFAEVLLLKLEKLNECYAEAFDEFLNLGEFRLITGNIARQKDYYPAFKSFMNLVDLPFGYVSNMYTSKYVRHFYTDEEIDTFWGKWHKHGSRA